MTLLLCRGSLDINNCFFAPKRYQKSMAYRLTWHAFSLQLPKKMAHIGNMMGDGGFRASGTFVKQQKCFSGLPYKSSA